MELLNCLVAIGGDHGNTVSRDAVSVPECEVLRRIHGHDSIKDIEVVGNEDRENDYERETLELRYGAKQVSSVFGPYGDLPQSLASLKIPDVQMKLVPAAAAQPAVTSNIKLKEEPANV